MCAYTEFSKVRFLSNKDDQLFQIKYSWVIRLGIECSYELLD